jgi:hypothetical protein
MWLEKLENRNVKTNNLKVAAETLTAKLAKVFFGLGSPRWPYSPDQFEAAVRDILSVPEGSALPGHRAYCSALRKVWYKTLLVDELNSQGEPAISKKCNVKVDLPCWIAHPGLCATADAWSWCETFPLAKALAQHFLDNCTVGLFYKINLVCRDGLPRCIYLLMGHLRRASPRLAVFAMCRLSW